MMCRGFRVELHTHTRFSHDSILPLWLFYCACFIRRIDCVAITDHNEIKGALLFRSRYPKMNVIIGEEIFSSDGEIIGLFLTERIEPGLSAEETIEKIHAQGGIVCIPHPFDSKRYKTVLNSEILMEQCSRIDCIEKYNGRTLSSEDMERQQAIADRTGLPCVVGGDAHTFYELGRNYNIFKTPVRGKDDFLSQLSMIEYHTERCLSVSHWSTKIARAIKLLAAGNIQELVRKIIK
ncbi:MAG: hypothetical protein EOM40_07950 [Clostridia bacterium]|nr:hypothetical protein [Clostridia bacterium]